MLILQHFFREVLFLKETTVQHHRWHSVDWRWVLGEVCFIVWKSREIHHYQGVNMYNTSCLTAVPPLYDRIKSHAVISKLDTGELNQNYADTAVHHVT